MLTIKGVEKSTRLTANLLTGQSYLEEGKTVQARQEFAKILDSKEADVEFKLFSESFIGETFVKEKNYQEARKRFAAMLAQLMAEKKEPSMQALLQLRIAAIYIEEKRCDQARTELLALLNVKIDPSWKPDEQQGVLGANITARFYLGEIYVIEKNSAKAREAFESILRIKQLPAVLKKQAEEQLIRVDELEK